MYLARYGTLTLQLEGIGSYMSEADIAAEARGQLGAYETIVQDSTAIGYTVAKEGDNTVFVFTQKTGDKA